MKFELILKDPDGIYNAIVSAVKNNPDISRENKGIEVDRIWEQMREWTHHNEYVTLIYDTETKQMTVKQKQSLLYKVE